MSRSTHALRVKLPGGEWRAAELPVGATSAAVLSALKRLFPTDLKMSSTNYSLFQGDAMLRGEAVVAPGAELHVVPRTMGGAVINIAQDKYSFKGATTMAATKDIFRKGGALCSKTGNMQDCHKAAAATMWTSRLENVDAPSLPPEIRLGGRPLKHRARRSRPRRRASSKRR